MYVRENMTESKSKTIEELRKYYYEKYFETGDEFYLGMMATSRQLEQESLT